MSLSSCCTFVQSIYRKSNASISTNFNGVFRMGCAIFNGKYELLWNELTWVTRWIENKLLKSLT